MKTRCVLLCVVVGCCFFFFKQKTAYEMRISDWSSDVCSSDLARDEDFGVEGVIVVDQADVRDELHPVEAVVVVAADEGRDEARARLGGEQRLIGREAE